MLKEPLRMIALADNLMFPQEDDWKYLEKILNILEVFEESTKEASKTNHITIQQSYLIYEAPNRTKVSGEEILLIFLRRLSYPCRLEDLVDTFGLSASNISLAFKFGIHYIHDRYCHLYDRQFNQNGHHYHPLKIFIQGG